MMSYIPDLDDIIFLIENKLYDKDKGEISIQKPYLWRRYMYSLSLQDLIRIEQFIHFDANEYLQMFRCCNGNTLINIPSKLPKMLKHCLEKLTLTGYNFFDSHVWVNNAMIYLTDVDSPMLLQFCVLCDFYGKEKVINELNKQAKDLDTSRNIEFEIQTAKWYE